MKKGKLKKNLFRFFNPVVICLVILITFTFIIAGCKAENVQEASIQSELSTEIESTLSVDETVLSEAELEAKINEISIEEVYDIISSGRSQDYIILDVRTPEEFSQGNIEGAVLIPVLELENRLDELSKNKPIIIYCRSGKRSRNAAIILVKNGFAQVYDMGGINDWKDKGYPTESEEK